MTGPSQAENFGAAACSASSLSSAKWGQSWPLGSHKAIRLKACLVGHITFEYVPQNNLSASSPSATLAANLTTRG